MRIESRIWNKMLAKILGYFWLPCPVCKEMFGGHETGSEDILQNDRAMIVCYKPECNRIARSIKRQYAIHR